MDKRQRERIYLNHIRRLEARNRVLAEMLAVERIYRQQAYAWYSKRLRSRFLGLLDMALMNAGKVGIAVLALLHLEAFKK